MGRTENRFWDFVIKHRLKVFIVSATILSMYARFCFRGFISGDMFVFLIPWYDAIEKYGGLKALSVQVGNYQISYQTLISLMTYLPVNKVYAYKGLSIFFDYALAAAAAGVIRKMTGSREKAAVTYSAIVILPTTILNSAAWGQCDSIYTFFLVMAFLLLLGNRNTAALFCYGVSLAFKLQAVFFLPFLLFYYVWSKKFPGWKFLLIFLPLLLFSIGGLVQGRSLLDIIQIYVDQGGQYKQISLYYPSFWNLLVETAAENEADHYTEIHGMCMAVTVIVLGGMMIRLIRQKKLNGTALLMTAALMMYTCVLFLPAMHERYSYPVLIFAVMAGALCPKMIPVVLGMVLIDLQTYGLYLFKTSILPWEFLVLLNIACYAGLAYLTWRKACVE